MPVTTPESDLQFPLVNYEGESVYDNADFRPFIIPYLLDDPSSAKGTIIVTSGGGNTSRSNPVEAYDRKSTRLNSSHVSISYAVLRLQNQYNLTYPEMHNL